MDRTPAKRQLSHNIEEQSGSVSDEETIHNDGLKHQKSFYQPDLEEPKIVLKRGFKKSKLFLHVMALAATAIVVQFTFRNYYWFDDGGSCGRWLCSRFRSTTGLIQALQYVAKVYSVILAGSITAMVMNFVRHMLLGKHGLPFGLLMIGYQANSLDYVWSSKKVLFTKRFRARPTLLVFLAAVIVLYMNLIDPSAAILVVPSLDWWPIKNPYGSQMMTPYVGNDSDIVYPLYLNTNRRPDYQSCTASNTSVLCPGGGYRELYAWAAAQSLENAPPNTSMSEVYSGVERILSSESLTQQVYNYNTGHYDNHSVAIATTLHQTAVQTLAGLWQWTRQHGDVVPLFGGVNRPLLSLDGPSAVKSPLVQVQCGYFDYKSARSGNIDGGVTYPTDLLNSFGSNLYQENQPVAQQLYNFSRSLSDLNFTWVDLSAGTTPPRNASLGAIVTVPSIGTLEYANGNMTSQESYIVPCTIDARWVASSTQYDPTNSNLMATNVTSPSSFAKLYATHAKTVNDTERAPDISDALRIDLDWAALLNNPGELGRIQNGTVSNTTMIQSMLDLSINCKSTDFCHFSPPSVHFAQLAYGEAIAQSIATMLSMVLADGLSRTAYSAAHPFLVINATSPDNLLLTIDLSDTAGIENFQYLLPAAFADMMQYSVSVMRYGYGYGLQEGVPVKLSIGTVLVHAVLVLVYGIYRTIGLFILCVRCRSRRDRGGGSSGDDGGLGLGLTSDAWDDTSQILALALLSDEAGARRALGAAGTGVKKNQTLQKWVKIREGKGEKVQMVIGEYEESREGREEEKDRYMDIGGRYRRLVPGKKYF